MKKLAMLFAAIAIVASSAFAQQQLFTVGTAKKEHVKNEKAEAKCVKDQAKCVGVQDNCVNAQGKCAKAEGKCAKAEGKCAKAEGKCAKAEGKCAKAEGKCAKAEGKCAKAEGKCCNGCKCKCVELGECKCGDNCKCAYCVSVDHKCCKANCETKVCDKLAKDDKVRARDCKKVCTREAEAKCAKLENKVAETK